MQKKINLLNKFRCFSQFSTTSKTNKKYYEILQVNPRCSQLEIKKSFLRLAKIYHPDVYKGADITRFKEIQEAYEFLRMPERRKAYDKERNFQNTFSEKDDIINENNIYTYSKKQDIDFEKEFAKFFSTKIVYTPDMVQVVDDPLLKQLNEEERWRYEFKNIANNETSYLLKHAHQLGIIRREF